MPGTAPAARAPPARGSRGCRWRAPPAARWWRGRSGGGAAGLSRRRGRRRRSRRRRAVRRGRRAAPRRAAGARAGTSPPPRRRSRPPGRRRRRPRRRRPHSRRPRLRPSTTPPTPPSTRTRPCTSAAAAVQRHPQVVRQRPAAQHAHARVERPHRLQLPGRREHPAPVAVARWRRRPGSPPRGCRAPPPRARCGAFAARGCARPARRAPTRTLSPTRSRPSSSVPVATVPKPVIVNTRSMPSRGRPHVARLGHGVQRAVERLRERVQPRARDGRDAHDGRVGERGGLEQRAQFLLDEVRPVVLDEVALREGDDRRGARRAGRGFRGARGSAASPPSSAATTNSARSMAPAPASMWRTKRTWPGTSTMETSRPEGRVSQAKPSSMVRPRRCSSARRSGG